MILLDSDVMIDLLRQFPQRGLAVYGVVWPSADDCNRALEVFAQYRLSHNAGLLDTLIGQIAVALNVPLCTFNQKHYRFVPGLQTTQPYERNNG